METKSVANLGQREENINIKRINERNAFYL